MFGMSKSFLITLAACALPVFGQSSVNDALVKHWTVAADVSLEVAKAMTAASYNLRPTPEEMSFGQLMAHIGWANISACGAASGMPRMPLPEKLVPWSKDTEKVDVDRDTALQFLT